MGVSIGAPLAAAPARHWTGKSNPRKAGGSVNEVIRCCRSYARI
jgi:hypothetical protein